jgi:hypothetical protein
MVVEILDSILDIHDIGLAWNSMNITHLKALDA